MTYVNCNASQCFLSSVSVKGTEFCIMFYSEWVGIPFPWMKYRFREMRSCVIFDVMELV